MGDLSFLGPLSVERFPFLKNAPLEGTYAANVKVTIKPLGREVRNGALCLMAWQKICASRLSVFTGLLLVAWVVSDQCGACAATSGAINPVTASVK